MKYNRKRTFCIAGIVDARLLETIHDRSKLLGRHHDCWLAMLIERTFIDRSRGYIDQIILRKSREH